MNFYKICCQIKNPSKLRFDTGNNFKLIDCGIWTGEKLSEAKNKCREHNKKKFPINKFSFYGIDVTDKFDYETKTNILKNEN